jgi:hypothetical protein
MLQWLKITDLTVDPAYQRPVVGNGVTQTINSHRHHEPVARAPASNSLSNSVSFAR